MKRRRFIETASGLLLASALGSVSYSVAAETIDDGKLPCLVPPATDDLNVVVIGIGGAGCRVVERTRDERIAGVTHSVSINRLGAAWIPDIALESGTDDGITNADLARIHGAIAGAHVVILVTGMDNSGGTLVAPIVAAANSAGAVLIATMLIAPFGAEGLPVLSARDRFQDIVGASETCGIFGGYREAKVHASLTQRTRMWLIESDVIHSIRHLVAAVAVPGLVGIDIEDIRHMFSPHKVARFGMGQARGANEAVRAAWQNLDSNIRLPSTAGALVTLRTNPAQLSLRSYKEAMTEVRKKLPDDALILATLHEEMELPGGFVQVGILVSDGP